MSDQPGWAPPPGNGGQDGWNVPAPPPQYGQQPGYGQPPPYGLAAPQAPRPGIIPLRPLGLGELYDGAFQAIRRNPRTMLGTAALVVTVLTAIDVLFQLAVSGSLTALVSQAGETAPDTDVLLGALGGVLTYALATGTLQLFGITMLTGLLIFVVSRAVLGQRMSLGELWAVVRRRLLALVGLNILLGLVLVAAFVVCLLPGLLAFLVSETLAAVLLVLGVLGSVVPLVLLYTRLSMAVPALLLEEARIGTAMRRSWNLVRGSFWRVFGILLLTAVITGITTLVISAPFGLVGGGLVFTSPDDPRMAAGLAPLQLVLNGIGAIIAATIVYPFTAAVTALLYIDLRMRREGLDVELARAAGSPTA